MLRFSWLRYFFPFQFGGIITESNIWRVREKEKKIVSDGSLSSHKSCLSIEQYYPYMCVLFSDLWTIVILCVKYPFANNEKLGGRDVAMVNFHFGYRRNIRYTHIDIMLGLGERLRILSSSQINGRQDNQLSNEANQNEDGIIWSGKKKKSYLFYVILAIIHNNKLGCVPEVSKEEQHCDWMTHVHQ